jgi:galacturonosyltransferase
VIPGQTGLLCQAQNGDSLYEAMNRFLNLPHAEREQMGRAGRCHMEAVFDKNHVVQSTISELWG